MPGVAAATESKAAEMGRRRPLRIGLSASFFHADPKRPIFKGKTLLYIEESLAHWVMEQGAHPYLVPSAPRHGAVRIADLVADLDGLLLQGGADVAPQSYGEVPQRPEWSGDAIRDRYEIDLVHACMERDRPILGVCRGAQIVNVALGGTLYQDIGTQVTGALVHRDWDIYDQNFHELSIVKDSGLARLYPGIEKIRINSVHHQGIKELGQGLCAEGFSVEDGIIEAVRLRGERYVFAVQWHPEFQEKGDSSLLDPAPILTEFLTQVSRRASS